MKMGLMSALAQINNQIQGYQLVFVEKDHRGNSNRSLLHMKQFLEDPDAIAMLGGLHSPPYIKYRDFINENGGFTAGSVGSRRPDNTLSERKELGFSSFY